MRNYPSLPDLYPGFNIDRPAAMQPFDEAARLIADGQWPEAIASPATQRPDREGGHPAPEGGHPARPIIAVTCNLAPLELIHAAGALPVRLCAGAVCEANRGKFESPRDACQVVKGMADRFAALAEATGRPPAAAIIPATCDWKTRAAPLLGAGAVVRVLDVPRDKSPTVARRAWREQIADLGRFIEQATGAPIRRRALLQSIRLYQRAAQIGRRLADAMKRPHPPLAGADLMLAFNLFYSLPVEDWIAMAGALLREIESPPGCPTVKEAIPSPPAGRVGWGRSLLTPAPAPAPSRRRPRLLIAGAPIIWPHFALPLLIESLSGFIATDALCSSFRGFSDLVSVDETGRAALLDALADRYLMPCTCPCFVPNEEYLWRIETQARDFAIDGAVLHNLRNCYLFSMETRRLEAALGALGIPSLAVETDYESPAPAALATRLEAFLESLAPR